MTDANMMLDRYADIVWPPFNSSDTSKESDSVNSMMTAAGKSMKNLTKNGHQGGGTSSDNTQLHNVQDMGLDRPRLLMQALAGYMRCT